MASLYAGSASARQERAETCGEEGEERQAHNAAEAVKMTPDHMTAAEVNTSPH